MDPKTSWEGTQPLKSPNISWEGTAGSIGIIHNDFPRNLSSHPRNTLIPGSPFKTEVYFVDLLTSQTLRSSRKIHQLSFIIIYRCFPCWSLHSDNLGVHQFTRSSPETPGSDLWIWWISWICHIISWGQLWNTIPQKLGDTGIKLPYIALQLQTPRLRLYLELSNLGSI